MNYKRLTDKDMTLNLNINPQQDMTRHFLFVQRLWELENQIEKGELIKLPCRAGRAVWFIDLQSPYGLQIQQGKVTEYFIDSEYIQLLIEPKSETIMQIGYTADNFNKTWFTDETEAEQRLKELKGE